MSTTLTPPRGNSSFSVPQVTSDDLSRFFESHFSSECVQHFTADFFKSDIDTFPQGSSLADISKGDGNDHLHATEADAYYDNADYEEDDGLGYYPDGVKRTLTDEQIQIFRHSELEALRREEEKKRKSAATQNGTPSVEGVSSHDAPIARNVENMKDEDTTPRPSKKRRKKDRNGNGNGQQREPKPDLRKRTWDVVETGLDSLDYD